MKFIEKESRMVVSRGWWQGGMEHYCLMGTELQFCKMKRVLEVDGGDDCTMRMCLISLNCTFKNG